MLATFETSRYTEWGDTLPDFALAELFGVSATGPVIAPLHNSYLRIENRHPSTAGFTDTSLLPGPESRVPVRAHDLTRLPLTVVPRYPWFQPEMVYPNEGPTDQPGALFRETNGSKVAYFPGDVDRTFWRSGNPDLGQLLQNTVRWLLGDRPQPGKVDGEGIIEIFAWEIEVG